MQFFGCLFVLLFGILFFLYAAVRNIFTALFGGNTQRRPRQQWSNGTAQQSSDNSRNGWADWVRQRKDRRGTKQVFTDDVGEYVDYEEVK